MRACVCWCGLCESCPLQLHGVLCVSHVPGTDVCACVSVGVLCVSHVPGTCMLRQV